MHNITIDWMPKEATTWPSPCLSHCSWRQVFLGHQICNIDKVERWPKTQDCFFFHASSVKLIISVLNTLVAKRDIVFLMRNYYLFVKKLNVWMYPRIEKKIIFVYIVRSSIHDTSVLRLSPSAQCRTQTCTSVITMFESSTTREDTDSNRFCRSSLGVTSFQCRWRPHRDLTKCCCWVYSIFFRLFVCHCLIKYDFYHLS